MKNQIITIILILGLIGLVSAETIYPGEVIQRDLSSKMDIYTNYSLISATSPLNVSVSGLIATINIPTDYYPGSFEISFYGYKSDNPVQYVYRGGGGGGTRTIYVDKNVTEYVLKNDTIYLTGDCQEDVCDFNQSINKTLDITMDKPEKLGFFRRLWNWIKGIFS